MQGPVAISRASMNELRSAQSSYDAAGYGGSPIADDDIVLIARSVSVIIGVVRLCSSDGFSCLRGMQIDADYRRMGIGTDMLMLLMRFIGDQPSYCLPDSHLEGFLRAGR